MLNLELLDAAHLPQGWGCHPLHLTSLSSPRDKWRHAHAEKLGTSFPPLIRRDLWRLQKTAQTARYLLVSLRHAKQAGCSGIQCVQCSSAKRHHVWYLLPVFCLLLQGLESEAGDGRDVTEVSLNRFNSHILGERSMYQPWVIALSIILLMALWFIFRQKSNKGR